MGECLKLGTKVKFTEQAGRGDGSGQIEEIIYTVKRDNKISGSAYMGHGGEPSNDDDELYAICSQGITPFANKKLYGSILPITGITMGGGRRGNRKTRKTARRNNRRYSRRN